jgi:hypothetical protein
MIIPSRTNLILIGGIIAAAAEVEPASTRQKVLALHQTEVGAEILRLIVRDDLGGGANAIANALWVNL